MSGDDEIGTPDEPAESEAQSSGKDAEGPGVLGNLPRSRPSVRSPRRAESGSRPRATAGTPRTAAGQRSSGREPAPEAAAPREDSAARPTGPASGPEAELERLARAGLTVAGGAAALGLRAAGRAAAALRDAVERR